MKIISEPRGYTGIPAMMLPEGEIAAVVSDSQNPLITGAIVQRVGDKIIHFGDAYHWTGGMVDRLRVRILPKGTTLEV